jgi:hypothetical protein
VPIPSEKDFITHTKYPNGCYSIVGYNSIVTRNYTQLPNYDLLTTEEAAVEREYFTTQLKLINKSLEYTDVKYALPLDTESLQDIALRYSCKYYHTYDHTIKQQPITTILKAPQSNTNIISPAIVRKNSRQEALTYIKHKNKRVLCTTQEVWHSVAFTRQYIEAWH